MIKIFKHKYKMLGKPSFEVKEEKDLGVMISNELKYAKHCLAMYNKANRFLGFIARNINHKMKGNTCSLQPARQTTHRISCSVLDTKLYQRCKKNYNNCKEEQETTVIPSPRNKPHK